MWFVWLNILFLIKTCSTVKYHRVKHNFNQIQMIIEIQSNAIHAHFKLYYCKLFRENGTIACLLLKKREEEEYIFENGEQIT